jgi:hypothetical protein
MNEKKINNNNPLPSTYIVDFIFLGLIACLYAFAIGCGWIHFRF